MSVGRPLAVFCWLSAALTTVVHCQAAQANDLREALQLLGLTRFLDKLQQAGLAKMLYSGEKRTLFAPDNRAFELLESEHGQIEGKELKDLLLYHMAYSDWRSDWTDEQLVPTALPGTNLRVNVNHRGNTKLISVSGALVTSMDNRARNGIVHILDRVVYPLPLSNAYETLDDSDDLIKFKSLIDQANFAKILKYQEPLTVLIPNDDAFAKLPTAFTDVVFDEPMALAALLNYHLVNGTYYPSTIGNNRRLHTLEGSDIRADESSDDDERHHAVQLNVHANVVRSRSTTNGVLLVIDSVLFPPAQPKQMFYADKAKLIDYQQTLRRR